MCPELHLCSIPIAALTLSYRSKMHDIKPKAQRNPIEIDQNPFDVGHPFCKNHLTIRGYFQIEQSIHERFLCHNDNKYLKIRSVILFKLFVWNESLSKVSRCLFHQRSTLRVFYRPSVARSVCYWTTFREDPSNANEIRIYRWFEQKRRHYTWLKICSKPSLAKSITNPCAKPSINFGMWEKLETNFDWMFCSDNLAATCSVLAEREHIILCS